MSTNSQSSIGDPEPIVLYNSPLLLCASENVANECTFILKTINNDIIPNPPLIFEHNFYHRSNNSHDLSAHVPAATKFDDDMPFTIEETPNNNGASNDLEMMQIFYKNIPNDQPDLVDIQSLTSFEHVENKTPSKDPIVLSDDESDVIFVKEYKPEEAQRDKSECTETDDGVRRRNPVREARTNRGKGHLQKEHLLEEDFAFLDQFDEENLVFCKTKSSPSANSAASSVKEAYKEWPINVFERPEYNPQTDKIESLDYTIRDIQNKHVKKKPRLETSSKAKRKPKKKYVIKKRKPKSKKGAEKVPVKELSDVVATTFDMVETFLESSERVLEASKDGLLYDLVKNQTALMAVVNNYRESEVAECVAKLLRKS